MKRIGLSVRLAIVSSAILTDPSGLLVERNNGDDARATSYVRAAEPSKGTDHRRALDQFVDSGDAAKVARLLSAGAKPTARQLHVALGQAGYDKGQPVDDYGKIVRLLLKHGVPVDIRNTRGETPLHALARVGDSEALKLAIDAGANLNVRSKVNETPMDVAAVHGRSEVLVLLIAAGAEINNEEGKMAPLHFAALAGREKCVQVLLAAGASPDAADWSGKRPAHMAAENGHVKVARSLIRGKPFFDGVSSDQLLEALDQPRLPNDSKLLGAKDSAGWTLLHWAAAVGNLRLVEWLIHRDPSEIRTPGRSKDIFPIHLAAIAGHADIVAAFLAADGKLLELFRKNAPFMYTPLDAAVTAGSHDVARLLLTAGADPDAGLGFPHLHSAVSKGDLEMARVLLTAGANPDQKDLRSWTPLHIAGGRGNLQMISVLLEHGADPTIVNRRGDTPANLAEVLGQHEAAARLREATQDLHE